MDFSIACITKTQSGNLIMEPLHPPMVSVRLSSGIIPFISHFQVQRCSAQGPAQEPGKNPGRGEFWAQVGMQVRGSWPCVRIHESCHNFIKAMWVQVSISQTLTCRSRGSSLDWSVYKSCGLERSERSVLHRGNIWQHQLSAAVTPVWTMISQKY